MSGRLTPAGVSMWVPERANGAGDRSRTGYLNLGKVALYQVSYARAKPEILGLDHRLRLRGVLSHHRADQLRVLVHELARAPRVKRRGDDVVLGPVRVRHHEHPPLVEEHLHAVREVDPVAQMPLHHRAHHTALDVPRAELDRGVV